MPAARRVPTNIVFDVADVEGGGRHSQAQPVLLGHQDGLCEAVLLQILCCQLAAWHFHHYVFSTAKANTDSMVRGFHAEFGMLCSPLLKGRHYEKGIVCKLGT